MQSDRVSVKSNVTASMLNKLTGLQPKGKVDQSSSQIVQLEAPTGKPKSRFLKPTAQLSYVPQSQRMSIANSELQKQLQLNQLNQSQLSDLQAINTAPKMKSDIHQLPSNRPSRQLVVSQKIDMSFQEKLAEVAHAEKKVEEKVILQCPYQISIYYLSSAMKEFHEEQLRAAAIWNLSGLQGVVGEQNMLGHKENELGAFGNIEEKQVFRQKLIYEPQKMSLQMQKDMRRLPLIMILMQESQENYKTIITTLYTEVSGIIQAISSNMVKYDQITRDLAKYSVTAQVKQIIDKSYFKIYDKLTLLQQAMSQNVNKINEVILMTEGFDQTFQEETQQQMMDFIQRTMGTQFITRVDMLRSVYYACSIMGKQLEIQEEQQLACQQFVVAFNHGADSINLLFEFITCKLQKLKIKLSIANNKFNQIILPYETMKKQNDIILQDIKNYIFKMRQKKEFIMKELIRELFTKEQLEMLDEQYIVTAYTEFRNQILKHPNKFNYEIIKKKPFFIFQEYKLLFHAQLRLEEFYFQIGILDDIYNLVIKIPGIETTLITIMERRFKLRAASMLMEEQEQFRDTVVQLKKDMDELLRFQNYFINISANLPFAVQRVKDWIHTEVQQSMNLLKIINSKLHSIDVLANQISEQDAQKLLLSCHTLIKQIHVLIDNEIPPHYFDNRQLKHSQELTNAISEIYTKYIGEDDLKSSQPLYFTIQPGNTLIDRCHHHLDKLSKARDSLLIKKATQQQITQLYTSLTDLTVQYQIWEHMNATRYLMTHHMLSEPVLRIHVDQQDKYSINTVLKKLREQISYFDMNSQFPSSISFKGHLQNGVTFLTYFKENHEEYKKLAEKNVKNPGCVQIEPHLELIQTNVANFFKQKTCTILAFKDHLMKALAQYIKETKQDFEDSTKAAELDTKFATSETTEQDIANFLQRGNQKLEDLYILGMEAIKQEAAKKKQMTLEVYRLHLGLDAEIVQVKAKATTVFEEFLDFQQRLQLNSLPVYKQKLESKLKQFESLQMTIIIFDKTIEVVYYNCVELSIVCTEAQGKIETMLSLGSSQAVIESLTAYQKKQVEAKEDIKQRFKSHVQLHPQLETMIMVTLELQQYIIELLQLVGQTIINFVEIYTGFQFFQDQINLLNEDFFVTVNRWLTFFQGKKSDRTIIFADANAQCELMVSKFEKYPLLKLPCFKLVDAVSKIILLYETDFNPEFMKTLSDFGHQYHSAGNKIQNFADFQNDLKFLLIPEGGKEVVRQALQKFYDRNKQAEVPLSRMTQFLRSVQAINKDERMKSQKKLKKLQNLEEILQQMGQGQMDNWISICKTMTNTLDGYFHDAKENNLKHATQYLINIEDQSRSLSNIELKNFIAKFAEMLKKDHDLSKY